MVFSRISLTFLLLSMKTSFGISSGPRLFFLISFLMAFFISNSVIVSLRWLGVFIVLGLVIFFTVSDMCVVQVSYQGYVRMISLGRGPWSIPLCGFLFLQGVLSLCHLPYLCCSLGRFFFLLFSWPAILCLGLSLLFFADLPIFFWLPLFRIFLFLLLAFSGFLVLFFLTIFSTRLFDLQASSNFLFASLFSLRASVIAGDLGFGGLSILSFCFPMVCFRVLWMHFSTFS